MLPSIELPQLAFLLLAVLMVWAYFRPRST
jgi:hypothetical protein